jgi:hypothetical protein
VTWLRGLLAGAVEWWRRNDDLGRCRYPRCTARVPDDLHCETHAGGRPAQPTTTATPIIPAKHAKIGQ